MTSYIPTTHSTTNLTLATWSGISTRYEAYGWKPTEMTEEQCFRPRERWNMRPKMGKREKRTIGWLAGHEIHLEIEGVLDKNKIK